MYGINVVYSIILSVLKLSMSAILWVVAIVVGIFLLKRFCPNNQVSSDIISALGDELRLRTSNPLANVAIDQVMRYNPVEVVQETGIIPESQVSHIYDPILYNPVINQSHNSTTYQEFTPNSYRIPDPITITDHQPDHQHNEHETSSEYSRFDHIIDIISENRTLPEVPEKSYVTAKDKKHEAKCREIIQRLTGRQFRSVRPNFLKNPKTNRNLEIDCYNDELMLAIEYNGVQHYQWPNFLPMTYDEFLKQVERDAVKKDLCDFHGVYLIVVPYTIQMNDIESYIIERLPRKFFHVKEFRDRIRGLYYPLHH